MNYVEHIRNKTQEPKKVSVLTESMMWEQHGPLLWEAEQFEGKPYFYPVYRWKNYYSYSLLTLIIKKDILNLDSSTCHKAERNEFLSLLSNEIIDNDIVRVGGPLENNPSISDPDVYLVKLANAIKADIKLLEMKNPGYQNILMCGGKDSMNMLLLPWENPVIAVSADPNYTLVQEFIKRNNLNIELRRLEDIDDPTMSEGEILECCCRMELSNWKWGRDLKDISDEFDHKVIFWKGQYSELLLADNWKHMIWPMNAMTDFLGKLHRNISPFLPKFIRYAIAKRIAPMTFTRSWYFTSIKLGAHMAFIRSICSALALSPYVGPNVTALFSKIDLIKVVEYDRRHELGPALCGKDVWYPQENPGPPLSAFRARQQRPVNFIGLLKKNGIKVISDV